VTVPAGWGSQISRQSSHVGGKVVNLFAPAAFTPQEISLLLISVRDWVDPRAIVRREGICQRKIPMTPSIFEPATFQFVAQCLNQLRHRVPKIRGENKIIGPNFYTCYVADLVFLQWCNQSLFSYGIWRCIYGSLFPKWHGVVRENENLSRNMDCVKGILCSWMLKTCRQKCSIWSKRTLRDSPKTQTCTRTLSGATEAIFISRTTNVAGRWSSHCAASRRVAGLIPDGVIGNPTHIILLAAPWHWGLLSLQQKWLPAISPAGKDGRWVGLTNLPLLYADCLEVLETSTSWNPQELSRSESQ